MAKKIILQKVEVSIERDKHDSAYFIVFDKDSNRTKFRSSVYSQRGNAIRGAIRKAKSEGWVIKRWLK